MAKIYQLTIGMKQINDVYYDVVDAFDNATQFAVDASETVEIWEAEEHEIVPHDLLDWARIWRSRQ